jgi:hypothetical protein
MRLGDELRSLARAMLGLLRAMLWGWIVYVVRRCRETAEVLRERREKGGQRRGHSKARCMPVSGDVYRRPDPMIYSQYYLMSQGIAVTWDNPDIAIRKDGALVPSWQLQPDTEYEIVARVWNGSTSAPAVHLPVAFSYLDFGIGTTLHSIGQTFVDLPVKGAPGHPTFAHMPWRTPATAGHYCLLVALLWSDDANPDNNLGQENLDVGALNSPRASFRFPVRNGAGERRLLRLEADAYRVPPLPECEPEDWGKTPEMPREEVERHRRAVLERNARGRFPLPAGWRVEFSRRELLLGPGEQEEVTVDVVAPDDDFRGRQAINVNAFHGDELVGGVTLHVTG